MEFALSCGSIWPESGRNVMLASDKNCVLGLDFGSDNVRAVIVRVSDGEELSSGVADYPKWAEGRFCNPARQQFRQHPSDYLEAMTKAVQEALSTIKTQPTIQGIGVDTTGSSPAACYIRWYGARFERWILGRTRCHVHPLERPHVGCRG